MRLRALKRSLEVTDALLERTSAAFGDSSVVGRSGVSGAEAKRVRVIDVLGLLCVLAALLLTSSVHALRADGAGDASRIDEASQAFAMESAPR